MLGEGGMGIVYKARQLSLNRPVALKMIKAARFASHDEVRRFQNESEAVARLDHPNIVPVFEVGQYEDQHYFSMKLIAGESLDKRPKGYLADPRRTAELVATIAGAIHHAHQRGILHRDVKPANILIDPEGRPHITDFGLAKRVEGDSELTRSGAILGTPAYMAPEQASGKRGSVTMATDVYGLGAVLYVLLTGKAPFAGDSVIDVLEQVRERPPESPTKRNPRTPRDLEVICLKCLEKDPRRRYASADAVAEDLKHWLAGEPIMARPVGNSARFWMWCRRNPVVAGATALASVMLVVVAVLSLLYARQQSRLATARTLFAVEQSHRAEEQTRATADITNLATNLKMSLTDSNRRLAMLNFERARAACEQGQIGPGLHWLVKSLNAAIDVGDTEWKNLAIANLSAWQVHHLSVRGVLAHAGEVTTVAWSPDGRRVLTGSTDNTARLWDAASGQPIGLPLEHKSGIATVAFNPDGTTVLTAGWDGKARRWDAATSRLIGEPLPGPVRSVAFSPDLSVTHALILASSPGPVRSVAFSPDGKTILTGSHNRRCSGTPPRVIPSAGPSNIRARSHPSHSAPTERPSSPEA